jgi:stress-induced-phosphoprotein 1
VEFFTKQYDKALETYQLGLTHDPQNEELKDGLMRTHVEIRKASTGQVDEKEMAERQQRAMADPEIQGILSDPVMRQGAPGHEHGYEGGGAAPEESGGDG